MQRDRYPQDWEAISRRIRARSGGKCEWCGAKNGAYMLTERDGTRRETSPDDSDADEPLAPGQRITKIVLTVAHLGVQRADGTPGNKHDKMDVRDKIERTLLVKIAPPHDPMQAPDVEREELGE